MSEDLRSQIKGVLTLYSQSITDAVTKAAEAVAADAVTELQGSSPVKRGRYKRGWRVKTVYKSANAVRTMVHNQRYQLTHLLEFGHAKRGGGRTKTYPHIKTAEENATKAFTKKVEEAIRNG